jgi:hypothetical protein
MNNLFASSSQRLFIIGGMLLILTGMIFGDIFAVFILHPNIANIGQALLGAAEATLGQDAETVIAQMIDLGTYLENAGTKIDTHVHVIKFGYLALLLALIQPYVDLTDRQKLGLSQMYLAGAVILPPAVFAIYYVGLAYSPFQSIGWASLVADTGGLLIILACSGQLMGLLIYSRTPSQGNNNYTDLLQQTPRESRLLLSAGCLLLLAGFLFGAYYAASKLDRHEINEITALNNAIEKSMNKDSAGMQQELQNYGLIQADRGVSIAAHAHVNEFGMLALLLAFIQPYIFLSACWRRRWIILFISASAILPIAVLSELKFGLPAMILADISGLAIIISLFAMFVGVLRYTGK